MRCWLGKQCLEALPALSSCGYSRLRKQKASFSPPAGEGAACALLEAGAQTRADDARRDPGEDLASLEAAPSSAGAAHAPTLPAHQRALYVAEQKLPVLQPGAVEASPLLQGQSSATVSGEY